MVPISEIPSLGMALLCSSKLPTTVVRLTTVRARGVPEVIGDPPNVERADRGIKETRMGRLAQFGAYAPVMAGTEPIRV